jgi:NADPH:quinone reductase-like Zn-dependent oxidoreductase
VSIIPYSECLLRDQLERAVRLVEQVGPGVSQFRAGDAVFGATNGRFTGGYAEYAVVSATKLAKMPRRMGFVEAGSSASRGMHRVANG